MWRLQKEISEAGRSLCSCMWLKVMFIQYAAEELTVNPRGCSGVIAQRGISKMKSIGAGRESENLAGLGIPAYTVQGRGTAKNREVTLWC